MKRALFLTYYVPPRAAVASVRAEHLCATLARHGWEVVPVVPAAPGVQYQEPVRTTGAIDFKAPVRSLLGVRQGETTHARFRVGTTGTLESRGWKQRAIEAGHTMFGFANNRFAWLGPGTRAVEAIVREQRVDAIISTSPPEGTHVVASLARGTIPWVADLRDPWTRDDELAVPRWMHPVDRLLEEHVLEQASALVTVSEPLAERLRERYNGKAVHTITNAFSSEHWWPIAFYHPPAATFVHAGSLYRGHRDPRAFFEALAGLLARDAVRRDEVVVDLYGEDDPWLVTMVEQFGLKGVVRFPGRLPRLEVMKKLRSASRLLLVAGSGSDERGTYTGKLFEYFGARRKIIAVGGPAERTVIDDALARCEAGVRGRTASQLEGPILEAIHEWRSGYTATVSEASVAPFEARHLGEAFAQVLESVSCER